MQNIIEHIPPIVWVLLILSGYGAIIFYRVKGIWKSVLLKIMQVIEDKASSEYPQVNRVMQQVKLDISEELDNANLKKDVDVFILPEVDPKPEKKVHKGKKFLRVLANIAKFAIPLIG